MNKWSDKKKRYKRIIDEDDETLGKLGHGTFGAVYKMKDQKENKVVAVKQVELRKVSQYGITIREFKRQLKIERETMAKCDHRHIIKYLDYYETKKFLYIVMEYCSGGNLQEFIVENGGSLKESVAQNFSAQISQALLYMRSKDIVHRDLKPENIVLTESTEKALIKITDFGTAKTKRYDTKSKATILKTYTGTPDYMAPEVSSKGGVSDHKIYDSSGNVILSPFIYSLNVHGYLIMLFALCPLQFMYTHVVDLWSFGLIIHKMTTGTIKLKEKQVGGRIMYDFSAVPINGDGKALLVGLLQPNPKHRSWDILRTNQWLVSQSGADVKGSGYVNVPAEFLCPLSKQLMRVPVTAFDGNTYEKSEIQKYLQRYNKSPMTGEVAEHSILFPNNAMKKQIKAFIKANGHQKGQYRVSKRPRNDSM